jgi:hypothetical protein
MAKLPLLAPVHKSKVRLSEEPRNRAPRRSSQRVGGGGGAILGLGSRGKRKSGRQTLVGVAWEAAGAPAGPSEGRSPSSKPGR